jgi:glycosyltransferase involved in cell wall biosynthesis
MRIAMMHVDLPCQSKGGVAYQVHYLANALVARGHQVDLFTFSPWTPECAYHVRQYPAPRCSPRVHFLALALRAARTDFRGYDVLHAHGDNFLLQGRSPQVRTFYGAAADEAAATRKLSVRLYYQVISLLEQRGARVSDLNVGISQTTCARIRRIDRIIPCGVDLGHFRPGPKAPRPVILFVGTAGGRKRGAFLAEIFQREILPSHPNAELWTVCDRPLPGPGIRNWGRVSTPMLAELYRQAWLFCLPSRYEGFGVPYIEAMAAGTAVVASPNPGAREVLAEGKFGALAPDGALGETVCALLSDPKRRAAYASDGPERARQYGWDEVTRAYEAVYVEAARRSRAGVRH